MLTDIEQKGLKQTADLWKTLGEVVGNGPTRDNDLNELIIHIHAIQRYLLAQSVCREHPTEARLLGEVLKEKPNVAELQRITEQLPALAQKAENASKRKVDKVTGEITEEAPEEFGRIHTDDCPKGNKVCDITEKFARLSRTRFRETLCESCFKAHR